LYSPGRRFILESKTNHDNTNILQIQISDNKLRLLLLLSHKLGDGGAVDLTGKGSEERAKALEAQKYQYLGVVLHHALTAFLDAFCVLRESSEGARGV
jgi:hypothetical protein